MTPERHQRIGELFDEALELGPEERAAFLDRTRGEDAALRVEVERLLANHLEAGEFLSRPAMHVAAALMAQNQDAHAIGKRIGQYQLLSLLGAGGMGQVYLAQDTRLGRRVALKLLPAHLTGNVEHLRRFSKEARAVVALNHPNILTIHDFGEADGVQYIATEYVEGQTLRRRLNQGQEKPTLTELLDVALQTAGALEAAHRAGVVHRDIKPENIMIRPDGVVKVLDFGLARINEPPVTGSEADGKQPAGSLTQSGHVFGTAAYMSPEQARGQQVDPRTDLFSLGVVLYEMCAGRRPFTGLNSIEMLASILHHEPPPLGEVAPETPAPLERLIHRMLRKDREARPPDAGAVLAELKDLRRRVRNEESGNHGEHCRADGPDAQPTSRLKAAATGESLGDARTSSRSYFSSFSSFSFGLMRPVWRLGLAAFVVVLTGAAFYSMYRRPAALIERDTILLADVDNKTGDAAFDGAIRQGLVVQLGQSPFLTLYPDPQIRETLRMMHRPPDDRVTSETGLEICRRRGLKALLTASIAPLGNHYLVVLEVLQARSGAVMATEMAEAGSKEEVLLSLGQAARRLRERLGESLSQIQQYDKPIEQATTSSLDALKAYSLGVESTWRGRYLHGLPAYQRAVELDPNFALAWLALARESYNTGFTEEGVRAANRAYELRDRTTENEKLRIANFYHISVTGDLEQAIRSAEVWRQTYPSNWLPLHSLSDLYFLTGQYELSLERGRAAVDLNPEVAAVYSNPAAALYGLDRFDEAAALYRQAMQRGLDAPEYHAFLYRIADIRGDAAEVQKQLEWSAGRDDWGFNLRALALARRGQWRAAGEHSGQARQLFEQRDAPALVMMAARYDAVSGALLGDCRTARRRAAQVLSHDFYLEEQAKALAALALCGEAARAGGLAARLREQHARDTLIHGYWSPVIEAAGHLARREPERVLETLSTNHPNAEVITRVTESWPPWLRGQAWLQKGAGAQAADEFRSILDHRGRTFWQLFHPLAQLGLARAIALTGDARAARQAYRDFFALWKEADADLPVMIEARKEFEKLPDSGF
jgi:serine/threonine protein kinase/Tfp pilus assembly protein PilF